MCGGPNAPQELLSDEQKDLRARWGCDADSTAPTYLITCPRCDGSRFADGKVCDHERCIESGPNRGMVNMHRCPCSQNTPEISAALRHYSWKEGGALPECGGTLDQSPSYLQFCSVISGETSRVQKETMQR